MPGDNPAWAEELRADLDGQPVNQYWLPGIPGHVGRAREAGFARGSAPFVAYADPDDRILPGTFAALLAAMLDNPGAPFAWAGEQKAGMDLAPIGAPAVRPSGYDQRLHRNNVHGYCHGVHVIRRGLIAPALPVLRACHLGAEGVFLAHVANVGAPVSAWARPVHVPMVGRLWRQHPGAAHHAYTGADRERNARALGLGPQYLHGGKPQAAAPCATCGAGYSRRWPPSEE